jgi:hypothetical protein
VRGKIDLHGHKLANVYRPPAERQPWKRARREKNPDEVYRQLWALVRGAVRDTFASHPEYLTAAGRGAAERSITKRVTGTLYGYATQVARGRSVASVDAPMDAAADQASAFSLCHGRWTRLCSLVASQVRSANRICGDVFKARHPKFTKGGRDESLG